MATRQKKSGTLLINYFSKPCKPTKINEGRTRNLPGHNHEKWEQFKDYCVQDVEAEREITKRLEKYIIPDTERELYLLDQKINDRGVLLDLELIEAAQEIDNKETNTIINRLKELTNLDNPNSGKQIKDWLKMQTGEEVNSLDKDHLPGLIEDFESDPLVREVLELKQSISRTSVKKYAAMSNTAGADSRGRGYFQFYGANRTGRWSGRFIQPQNLARNKLSGEDLEHARTLVKSKNIDEIKFMYGDVQRLLKELIRTSLTAPEGKELVISDFASIESRVLAWLAGEEWKLEVFRTHGKIYEANAAKMFNKPLDSINKGSDLRMIGKVAELALGFQGAIGALNQMETSYRLNTGWTDSYRQDIVKTLEISKP